MGKTLVSVEVTGAHHNGVATDIDQLAAKFVAMLKEAGHEISLAYLEIVGAGEKQNLNPAPAPVAAAAPPAETAAPVAEAAASAPAAPPAPAEAAAAAGTAS